jgi:hypothetical protein
MLVIAHRTNVNPQFNPARTPQSANLGPQVLRTATIPLNLSVFGKHVNSYTNLTILFQSFHTVFTNILSTAPSFCPITCTHHALSPATDPHLHQTDSHPPRQYFHHIPHLAPRKSPQQHLLPRNHNRLPPHPAHPRPLLLRRRRDNLKQLQILLHRPRARRKRLQSLRQQRWLLPHAAYHPRLPVSNRSVSDRPYVWGRVSVRIGA